MGRSQRSRLGIALGAGAARGWAHIGVLRVLARAGREPAFVAGTSIGALVGAAYAAGRLDALEGWVRGLQRRDVVALMDLAFSGGVMNGHRLFELFAEEVPDLDIADLERPYAAVATDLETGREVWLTRGSLHAAVRASIALPGLISPVRHQGRWLVDGGLVNPVPVSVCHALGAEEVIAVDLQTTLLGRRHEDAPTGSEAEADADADAGAGAGASPPSGTRSARRPSSSGPASRARTTATTPRPSTRSWPAA